MNQNDQQQQTKEGLGRFSPEELLNIANGSPLTGAAAEEAEKRRFDEAVKARAKEIEQSEFNDRVEAAARKAVQGPDEA